MRFAAWQMAVVMAAAGWSQSDLPIAREGRYWVQFAGGAAPVERNGRLRVTGRAQISVRGEDRSDVAYALKKRARADSEAAARQLLREARLQVRRGGAETELALRSPHASVDAELRLRVPSALREVILLSEAGGLEAQELSGALRAETGGGHVRMDAIQGAVTVRTGGGNVRLGKLGGVVRCVAGGGSILADWLAQDADLSTGGGEIVIRRAEGVVRLTTGGGNIRVERARSVAAFTTGGLIEVLEADGPVSAEAGAGAVRVRSARGLRVSSGAGPIQLEGVSGRLRASTGRGDIVAALAGVAGPEESLLSTGAGDITVFLPSNLAVTVEAVSALEEANRILSEFPEIQTRRQGRGLEARGSLNGGGPLLRLAVSGGSIYLRRRP